MYTYTHMYPKRRRAASPPPRLPYKRYPKSNTQFAKSNEKSMQHRCQNLSKIIQKSSKNKLKSYFNMGSCWSSTWRQHRVMLAPQHGFMLDANMEPT